MVCTNPSFGSNKLYFRNELQPDTIKTATDTSKMLINTDAVFNRPFLLQDKLPVAIGGYIEANTHYETTDGITDGLSFQMRRLTLFLSTSLHSRIKFLTEIEFEDGAKEINIEFAALDIQLHQMFNFRGGIVMNPIGAFNQNHDGPHWEFIDRPISATQLLPATFSNAGGGVYGKMYKKNMVFGYECYLTNGLNNNIISNINNKTYLPAAKLDANRFEESFNGIPMITAKTTIRYRTIGELGISYMGGVYNKYRVDGLNIDKKRRTDVLAVDFNTTFRKTGTNITTEFAFNFIDVPNTYTQQFGKKQFGGFIDIVQPIIKRKLAGYTKASINGALRIEYVDWNFGTFTETSTNIGDQIFSITPALSFRTSQQTVLRFNYRYGWYKDLLGNPSQKTAAIQLGFSSYF